MKIMKKIVPLILIMVSMLTLLTGCSIKVDISPEEAYKQIQEAIVETEKQVNYYVKEKTVVSSSLIYEYALAYQQGENNGLYDSTTARVSKWTTVDNYFTYADSYTFMASLPKTVKPKNAVASDYKYYRFNSIYNKDTKKSIDTKELTTPESILSQTFNDVTVADSKERKIDEFSISNIITPFKELKLEQLDFTAQKKESEDSANLIKETFKSGVYKQGKVTFYRFEVKDVEGMAPNRFANKGIIEVQVINGKILKIAHMDSSYRIDIIGQGPKISMINYDEFGK